MLPRALGAEHPKMGDRHRARRQPLSRSAPMSNATDQALTPNASTRFADPNRHLVEVPDSFAIARWPRDVDQATIARCMLGP